MLIGKLISQDKGSYKRMVNIAGGMIFSKVFYFKLRGFRIISIFSKSTMEICFAEDGTRLDTFNNTTQMFFLYEASERCRRLG